MEPCAFNAMMEQYEKLVYTVCLRLVHDEHLAQDLTQETFLSAWVHRSACPDGAQKAWLCRIAANKAKRPFEKRLGRRTQLTDFAAEGTACTAPACTESLAAQAELRIALARCAGRRYALCPSHTRLSAYCIFCRAARWMTSPVRWAACPKQCIRSLPR